MLKTKQSKHRRQHTYDHSLNYLEGFLKCAGLIIALCVVALILLDDPIVAYSTYFGN
jgi:hypothetical protein